MPKIALPAQQGAASLEEALLEIRDCMFRVGDELVTLATALYAREKLPVGGALRALAIAVLMSELLSR